MASIKNQSHSSVDQVVFRDLPNKEAHDTLYKHIMDNSHKYDVVMKLDADMVLNRTSALTDALQLFQRDPELDHALLAVHDWYTQAPMWGVILSKT